MLAYIEFSKFALCSDDGRMLWKNEKVINGNKDN